MDPYHVQQQQQTNALQHQFEQFNMVGKLPSSYISSWITLPSHVPHQTNALQLQFEQFNIVGKLPSSDVSWIKLLSHVQQQTNGR